MPTYRIRSGDMDVRIKTPQRADGRTICICALAQHIAAANGAAKRRRKRTGPLIGRLITVSGGQYKGDATIYLSSEFLLADMGYAT